ncbi:glycosyltransferase family 39 protein [Desulfofustis glycolicus]|uniref:4-amino-4-deoxy-L-arabinose transferase n=1 Tax=Desulfofustis glycolicus DSM 9705 TaxID=1121409 RepID=A0A1M5RZV8_9BACT|nr:glycosyltransferase family 39 protein [Desulfofustis glycolicus]MCB2216290.1 glycosyltransferase family 39 protein [Desulfobulbaceae bacterium]SHH31887.1 4-amino-4-deoxy-L-arabinose transferase [Desulfofustis glycolicus DSM 9705]
MLTRAGRLLLEHVVLFIIGYFVLQVVVRLITTPGAVIDESEQLLLTQHFSLGYNAQPPLYTWTQMAFFALFGPGILALTVLKNLLLALVYLLTYRIGRLLTGNRQTAALGTLSLLLLPQIVGEAQVDQIHSVLVTTAAAATLYLLILLLRGGGAWVFILLGVTVGCGILAKYNFVLVPLALLFSAVSIPKYREKLLRPQLLLAILTAALLVAPHGVWFLNHPELATAETLQRMQLDQDGTYLSNILRGMADLAVAILAFIGPFLLCALILLKPRRPVHVGPQHRLLARFIGAALLLIVAVILVTETTQIKQRWLQPFLFIFPLLLLMCTPTAEPPTRRTAIFALITVLTAAIVTAVIPLRIFLVDLSDGPRRDNYPFPALARTIADSGFTGGTIVAEDKFIGGNMRLFFPESTVITPSLPLQPYRLTPQLLVVWQVHDPAGMIGDTALEQYRCRPFRAELPFRHSRNFTFRAAYRICERIDEPSGGTDRHDGAESGAAK